MANETAKALIDRGTELEAKRSTFDSHFSQVRQVIYPTGEHFIERGTPGAKAHTEVLDNTAEMANEFMAAGFIGVMSNPATKWFKLKTQNEDLNRDPEVATWLEDATNRMLARFNSPKAGFATQQYSKYLDLGAYGTGAMFIEDIPGFGPLFRTRPLKEIFVAEGDNGIVDTVYRKFQLTARQAVQKYGDEAGPKTIEKANDIKKQDEFVDFLHAVFPRSDAQPDRLDGPNRPIASIHVNVWEKMITRNSGFFEMPAVVPRLPKRADEVYGRGRGMVALADTRMLQRAMRSTIKAQEKSIDPSIIVPDDGMMSPMRLGTGGITHVRADLLVRGAGPRAFNSNARPDLGEDFMNGIRTRIETAFFKQILQTLQDPRMTATQVLKIAEEALRVLGPTLGRLQTEDLGPMIDRVFAIMLRANMLLPVPAVLSGVDLEIEYLSAVAQAQRLSEASAIGNTLDIIAPIRATNPDIDDNFDADKVFRHVASLLGWPLDTLLSTAQVTKLRRARAETQAAEVQKQDFKDVIGPAAQAIPALTELANRPAQGTA